MENENKEVIHVITLGDGIHAEEINSPNKGKKFKIAEIMLGIGYKRKPIKWTKRALIPNTECKAEILKSGKLRII